MVIILHYQGGQTFILKKSLAVAKGGTKAINVYAEKITKRFCFYGLKFTIQYVTGQVASGANIVFYYWQSSAYGCKPAPSIKLATNNFLFQKQYEDMDINCGEFQVKVQLKIKGKKF